MRHWNRLTIKHLRPCIFIFTLPMRHWNQGGNGEWTGRERNFYPTYEALKLSCQQQVKQQIQIIFTLPMRHWNLLLLFLHSYNFLNFYPTYEALKPGSVDIGGSVFFQNFYPTYEALKLFIFVIFLVIFFHFYPTYEALKLKYFWFTRNNFFGFLPYLWGIETILLLE